MIIAVASGKGGTGKTTVSTNLTYVIDEDVCLVDLDVEEPNCHIFLKPEFEYSENVGIPIPEVDIDACDFCGECGKFCEFSAIISLKNKILTFPDLCHGCGGCALVCPKKAIIEVKKNIGTVEKGRSGNIDFIHGRLNIGEAMSPPMIRETKKHIETGQLTVIDAPPGTSCPVIEAVKGADYIILVTEPTPFGLNDLALTVEMLQKLKKPFGIVVNRSTPDCRSVHDFCLDSGIRLLAEITNDRKIAEVYSRGELVVEQVPGYIEVFKRIYREVLDDIDKKIDNNIFRIKE